MARIEDGAIIGKIGNVVGCRYKGKYYIKRRPVRTAPLSETEKKNHYEFGLAARWLKPLLEFIRLGFKGFNEKFEGYNAAKSMLSKQGLHRLGFESYIDPSEVLLSYGTLGISDDLQANLSFGNILEFTWNPGVGPNKSPRDRVMLLAYNIEEKTAVYELSGPKRSEGSASLPLTGYPPGTWHLYLAFVAEDLSRQSNSTYLGNVLI